MADHSTGSSGQFARYNAGHQSALSGLWAGHSGLTGCQCRGCVLTPDERRGTVCPHCSPTHAAPESRPWGVYVSPDRLNGLPTHLVVQPSNGAHVAQSDADWLWQLIRDYRPAAGHPDEIIDQAARVLRNRWSCNTPPSAENVADASALARAGLLVDPEVRAERDREPRWTQGEARAVAHERDVYAKQWADMRTIAAERRDRITDALTLLDRAGTTVNHVDSIRAALTGGADG